VSERTVQGALVNRLAIRAYHRAMHDLRERHRAEFDHLLEERRAEAGLYRDGRDVFQISNSSRIENLSTQEAVL